MCRNKMFNPVTCASVEYIPINIFNEHNGIFKRKYFKKYFKRNELFVLRDIQ